MNPFEEWGLRESFPSDRTRPPKAVFSNASCAIWRSVLLEVPFDEKLKSSEDLVWRMKFESDEIAYVPEATVFHSHPINFRYWAQRFERDAAATIVMRYEYGIINPYLRRYATFTGALQDFLGACWYRLSFCVAEGYFRFIPLVPFFEATRVRSVVRGLRNGQAQIQSNYD